MVMEHFLTDNIIYFKLPNLEDKVKLSFHYELSGEPNADYIIFAIVLHEKDLIQIL